MIIVNFIFFLIAAVVCLMGCNMAFSRYGTVNGEPLNVALAMMVNKLIGAVYIVGSLIVIAILLS